MQEIGNMHVKWPNKGHKIKPENWFVIVIKPIQVLFAARKTFYKRINSVLTQQSMYYVVEGSSRDALWNPSA